MAFSRSSPRQDLTAEYLRSRLHYDPQTGVLTWHKKPETTPHNRQWNTRFAGKPANHHITSGHIQVGVDGVNYLAHRLAWLHFYGEWPTTDIDHDNRVRDDNRLKNLRPATPVQNSANSCKRSNNTSGYKGVVRRDRKRPWEATATVNHKRVRIGSFFCPTAAALAYDAFVKKSHGQFAVLNFQKG